MYTYSGFKTWSFGIRNGLVCQGGIQQPKHLTIIVRTEELVRKRKFMSRSNYVHYFSWIWPKCWTSTICWVGCWPCWLSWISYGWWSKRNCYWDYQISRLKGRMGLLKEFAFSDSLAISPWKRIQNA